MTQESLCFKYSLESDCWGHRGGWVVATSAEMQGEDSRGLQGRWPSRGGTGPGALCLGEAGGYKLRGSPAASGGPYIGPP